MEFYKSCFGGELAATKVKDSPAKDFMPAVEQEKIVNAPAQKRQAGDFSLGQLRPDRTPIRGIAVRLYLSGGTFEELKNHFERLGRRTSDRLSERAVFRHLRSTQR